MQRNLILGEFLNKIDHQIVKKKILLILLFGLWLMKDDDAVSLLFPSCTALGTGCEGRASRLECLGLCPLSQVEIVNHMAEASFGLWLIPHVENYLSKNSLREGMSLFWKKMRLLAREEYFQHPVCLVDTWWENSAEYVWKNYYSANETLPEGCYPSLKSDNVSWKDEKHLGGLKEGGNKGYSRFLFILGFFVYCISVVLL